VSAFALALALAPGPAAAAICPVGAGPRNAVSIRPLNLLERGFAGEYERYVLPPRLSIAVGPSVRIGGGEDFTGVSVGLGVEGRLWLWPKGGAPTCLGDRAMAGPYASLRFDAARTHLEANGAPQTRSIGTTVDLAETVGIGWRVTAGHVSIAPTFGVVTTADVAPRLATYVRLSLAMGLTVGWMF
jgi:hypothetical protein